MSPPNHARFALPVLLFLLAPAPRAQEDGHHGRPIFPEPDGELDTWFQSDLFPTDFEWIRARLDEYGTTFAVDVVSDSSWPLTGGLRHRRTDRALFDLSVEVDLDRTAGLANTLFFAEFYSLSGRNASDDVGDIQAFSNIDGDHVAQLAELWLERTFADGDLRIKAGKVDANSEFAHAEAALGFLHSSAGFSPTIFTFPSYPNPAVSLNVLARPSAGWQVGLGLYNAEDGGAVSGRRGLTADFDATFLIGQVDHTWNDGEGRAGLGLWHHTGDFVRFDGGTDSDATGAYALVEQRLLPEHPNDPDDNQGLTGFLQWGTADDDLSAIESHFGAGLVYTGLVPDQDSWETGLYLSHADLTNAPGAGLGGTELAIELFQELRITPTLTLKPDLQYIVDPSGSDAIDDAWVATLRLELSI